MLNFLGLEEQAAKLVICMVVFTCSITYPAIIAKAKGKEWMDSLLCKIGIGLALVAFVLGLLPGVALFFTFQWFVFVQGLSISFLVGVVPYLISMWLDYRTRKKKYRSNPVMLEVIAYCKKNHVVGIQCFPDRLRFFNGLENTNYCISGTETKYPFTEKEAAPWYDTDFRPDSWKAYDKSSFHCGNLVFSHRNYPNLPDVNIFAHVLAEELGKYNVVSHSTQIQYTSYGHNIDTGNPTKTTHTTTTYEDYFVYSTSALKKYSAQEEQKKKEDKERTALLKSQHNSWE